MIYTLVLQLCSFANDYSVELECHSHSFNTDNCATLVAELKHDFMVKEVTCLNYGKARTTAFKIRAELIQPK